jgi:hypothetical protein
MGYGRQLLLWVRSCARIHLGCGFSAMMIAFDPSKLNISGGVIHYKLRQQDGSFVRMQLPDTQHNRLFVNWVQVHD